MPDLSIIIVNYNTRDKLRDCLNSIQQQQGQLELETIVVDNASTDGSPEMLREFDSWVRLIEPERNTWFSGGNNLGIQAANADIVLLLNPDTLLQAGTLQTMLTYLQGHPEVSAVTCKQMHPDGDLLKTCSRMPHYSDLLDDTLFGILFGYWRKKARQQRWYADWERDSTRPIEVAPGSCIMTYRELLLSFGGFDEKLLLYFTDDDLCHNILAADGEIHFVAEATLLHYEKSTVRHISATARDIYFADMLVYCHIYYGAWRTRFLWVMIAITRALMIAAQKLRR